MIYYMPKNKQTPIKTKNGDTLGNRLRALRKTKGLTQSELGERVNVSTRALCSYETDQREPPAHLLPILAKNLDVSLDELMGLKTSNKKTQPKLQRRLTQRLEQIERLPQRKQRAILQVLDMALKTS